MQVRVAAEAYAGSTLDETAERCHLARVDLLPGRDVNRLAHVLGREATSASFRIGMSEGNSLFVAGTQDFTNREDSCTPGNSQARRSPGAGGRPDDSASRIPAPMFDSSPGSLRV